MSNFLKPNKRDVVGLSLNQIFLLDPLLNSLDCKKNLILPPKIILLDPFKKFFLGPSKNKIKNAIKFLVFSYIYKKYIHPPKDFFLQPLQKNIHRQKKKEKKWAPQNKTNLDPL